MLFLRFPPASFVPFVLSFQRRISHEFNLIIMRVLCIMRILKTMQAKHCILDRIARILTLSIV